MNEKYTTGPEYVDIHGRNLNVLVKSDGTILVPFSEIRKSGFHIFPKADFNAASVGKNLILEELRLYLLGAAREFIIQKDLKVVKNEDLHKSIEECHEKLISNSQTPPANNSPSGVLGRRLLVDPAELRKGNSLLNEPIRNSSNKIETNNKTNNLRLSDPANLRLPHQQNGPAKQTNSEFEDSYKKKGNYTNKSNRNEQKKYGNNRNSNSKNSLNNLHRTNSESRSTSENEEGQQYVKISEMKIKSIELESVMQNVEVVHVSSNNDKLKYWVQLVDNKKIVEDIVEKCLEEGEAGTKVEKPKLNEIYLAKGEDDDFLWYRVITLKVQPILKVHFIDFGNDAVVTELRNLSDELKLIPAQAVKIIPSRPEGSTAAVLELNEVYPVKYIKRFDDSTILVQLGVKNTVPAQREKEKPQEVIMMDEIKYSKKTIDNDVVKIIAHSDGKLYLRNKEHHAKLVEVEMEMKDLPREVAKNVVPGQLVLCTKRGSEEKLCRAKVEKVEGSQATVHYVDYHMEDKMHVNKLYCANKKIANIPATLIETPPLKGYTPEKFDDNVSSVLEDMISNHVKFNVMNSGNEFDLLMKDKLLSDILFPKPVKPQPVQPSKVAVPTTKVQNDVKKSEEVTAKVMLDDIASYEPPLKLGDYMLTYFKDCTDFTVTSTGLEESEMLAKCTLIDVTDTVPYEPEEGEMILAYFEDGWYRAVISEVFPDGSYDVLFVEYGNSSKLTKNEIRRFPKQFMEIPLMGLNCRLKVNNTEAINKRLEKMLEPNNIYEINFISFSPEQYQFIVDIPKVTQKLEQEGLI